MQEILYRLERKLFLGCGRTLQAQAPGVLAKSALGNQLLVELLDGHYLQSIPLGRLCANFRVNLGSGSQKPRDFDECIAQPAQTSWAPEEAAQGSVRPDRARR